MAGQNYVWQISTPNIGTGKGVISSAYNVDGKIPLTTITQDNPTGYTKLFPNSNSNDLNIKNLEFSIRNDGVITYRVQDGTQNPRQYDSLQELADIRGGWKGTTTKQIQAQMNSILLASVDTYNESNPSKKIGPAAAAEEAAAAAAATPVDASSVPLEIPEIQSNSLKTDYEDLVYPTNLGSNKQDFIQFFSYTYGGRSFSPGASGDLSLGIGDRNLKRTEGSVTLPIQPSINDTNTVEWGGENLNPISAFAASLSFGAMSNPSQAFNDAIGQSERMLKENANISPSAKLYLAGKAVGVNGLLSRIGGGVLNPNIELLFQGPQLRPFSFTFRLSPRDQKEAEVVKKIIRYFKQNMSVKTTQDNLFLKAPNVFKIKYVNGSTREDHKSLNRIKTCALQSCSVDYTPDGSYMTFNDTEHTMASYNLTLQFQELEPVTEKDYNDLNDINTIGY